MYNTTEAVKAALGQSVVRMRLLSESVSLLASDAKPIQSSDGKPIWVFAVGPFPDGKVDGEQLSSLSYTAGCCDGDIGIGNVYSASLSGSIHGVLNLLNVTFTAQVGVDVDGVTQWLNIGTFTVTECTRTDDSTTFTAYDAAYTVFGQIYNPTVLSGSTGRAILEDISRQTGIEVEPSTLAMCTMQTDGALTGHTYREMVGYIAALCGKNAVITRDGFLRFVWFSASAQTVTADDYYSGDMSNGGKSKLHGIACTVPATEDDRETQTITVGEAEKAIEIVNPYMTQSMLNSVWSQIGGYEYPVGSVGFYKGILTEPGDIISLTNLAGVTISFPVMHVSLEIDGGCRCTATSDGKSEADRGTGVKSPMLSAFNRVLNGVANGVYDGSSVASVTRFYQLGDTAPATPTTKNPPSGWVTTEPGYSENNLEHLYFVDRTIYDNDTYQYSAVSLSSSYGAAKAAHAKAMEAESAAEAAQEAADAAAEDAAEALEAANGAMTSANGKNKVFHQSTAPTTSDGLTAGDIWFDTGSDNRINTWTGSAWSAFELGENAIANLSITNAKIADATIQHGKIASLDMDAATTGKLKAQFIDVDELFADTIKAKVIDILNGTYYTEDETYDPDETFASEGFGRIRLVTYTDSRGNTAYKIAIECGTSYDSDDESYGSTRFVFDSTKGLTIETGGYTAEGATVGLTCDAVDCANLDVRDAMNCEEGHVTKLYASKLNDRAVPELESGRVTVTAVAATAGSVHIDFGTAFTSTPAITVTPHISAPQNAHVGVANTSTTGFDLTYWRSSAGTMTVSWMACG